MCYAVGMKRVHLYGMSTVVCSCIAMCIWTVLCLGSPVEARVVAHGAEWLDCGVVLKTSIVRTEGGKEYIVCGRWGKGQTVYLSRIGGVAVCEPK